MRNYLLEVGTENLPVDFQTSAGQQLMQVAETALKEAKLEFTSIETYSTPRRLALIINQLSDRQPDEVIEHKGPPANVAFKDDQPTKAAEGFAKRCNVSLDKLEKKDFDGVEYVVASVETTGKTAGQVLQEILPEMVLNLKGSHFMRWEDLEVRFSRPIRWLTSVMDNEELPVQIADVVSTKQSRGHRFYHPGEVVISSVQEYKNLLRDAYVLVDPQERKQVLQKQIEQQAQACQGKLIKNEKLLNLVNNLVEWPVAALGAFDKEYLAVPKEVITTVMSAHQKYFAVLDASEQNLLNHFICVNNRNGDTTENIIRGNQRVLKARLEDGAFYYNEDRKKSLADRIEDLKGMTFQKGLGSIYDKTLRMKALSADIADQLGYTEEQKQDSLRAAELSKADLPTFMVREFTELEGQIGRVYALKDNEKPEIAYGIGEHYLPRSVEDVVPQTYTGQVVSIADKMDTILSVFSIGKSPTGSADPLGLRRAALGVIITILQRKLSLNLTSLLDKNYDLLADIKRNPKNQVLQEVQEFIIQRLRIYLTDQGYRYDAVDAALNAKNPLNNILDAVERVKLVDQLVKDVNYTPLHESANRILRLVKTFEGQPEVNTELFDSDSEGALYSALFLIDIENTSYQQIIDQLKSLTALVEKFFDDVLVMHEDDRIKNNRLSLVKLADIKYKALADFSKVVN